MRARGRGGLGPLTVAPLSPFPGQGTQVIPGISTAQGSWGRLTWLGQSWGGSASRSGELSLHLATLYAWVSFASFLTAREGTALLLGILFTLLLLSPKCQGWGSGVLFLPSGSVRGFELAISVNSASLDLQRVGRKQQLPQ